MSAARPCTCCDRTAPHTRTFMGRRSIAAANLDRALLSCGGAQARSKRLQRQAQRSEARLQPGRSCQLVASGNRVGGTIATGELLEREVLAHLHRPCAFASVAASAAAFPA